MDTSNMEEEKNYQQFRTTIWFCGGQTDRYPTGAAASPRAWPARWLLVAGAGAGAEVLPGLLPRHQICHVNKSAGWGWVPSCPVGADPNHR